MPEELPQPGDQVDRYLVEGLLGEGGTARVYRVRHAELGTAHALKVLFTERPQLVERFLQEGRVQARLRHPHVVAVTDVLRHQGRPCLVMELVEGRSLAQHLMDDGALPWDQALDLLRPVVQAVAHAHGHGVLHRDLKPGNILLSEDDPPMARVTDFGLAKVRAEHARPGQTREAVAMGTPGFMAPEQWADATHVDERADVFSLCAVLYTAIAGRAPVSGTGVTELKRLLDGRLPRLDSLEPDCPSLVADVVQRGLSAEPDDRFDTADALDLALAAAVDGRSSPAPPAAALELLGADTLPSDQGVTPTLLPADLPQDLAAPPAPPAPLHSPAPSSPAPRALLLGGASLVALAAVAGAWLLASGDGPGLRPFPPAVIPLPAMSVVVGDIWGVGEADERPVATMELAAFGLDRTEVSTAAYRDCVEADRCTPPAWEAVPKGYEGLTGDDQPVVGVTWQQAVDYCAWKGGRLPTEWEWEAAATWSKDASTQAAKRRWPWGKGLPDCQHAMYQACGDSTLPVDALPEGAGAFGHQQLVGNVWEWTSSPYPMPPRLFRRAARHYVLRGGAYDSAPSYLRPTFRRHVGPSDARPNHGFRCAYDRPED